MTDLYGCQELAVGDLPDVDVAEDGGDDAVAGSGEIRVGEHQFLVVALGQPELFGDLHSATSHAYDRRLQRRIQDGGVGGWGGDMTTARAT